MTYDRLHILQRGMPQDRAGTCGHEYGSQVDGLAGGAAARWRVQTGHRIVQMCGVDQGGRRPGGSSGRGRLKDINGWSLDERLRVRSVTDRGRPAPCGLGLREWHGNCRQGWCSPLLLHPHPSCIQTFRRCRSASLANKTPLLAASFAFPSPHLPCCPQHATREIMQRAGLPTPRHYKVRSGGTKLPHKEKS